MVGAAHGGNQPGRNILLAARWCGSTTEAYASVAAVAAWQQNLPMGGARCSVSGCGTAAPRRSGAATATACPGPPGATAATMPWALCSTAAASCVWKGHGSALADGGTKP